MDATFERGRFFIGPNGFPRFAGSSSGVYLADTIRAQLSTGTGTGSDADDQRVAQGRGTDSEIEQAFISRHNEQADESDTSAYWQYSLRMSDLRPDETLRASITRYFEVWHPLFPFLDGAYLIRCFEDAVNMAQLEAMMSATVPAGSMSFGDSAASAFTGLSSHEALVLSAVFLAVWSLGRLELNDTVASVPGAATESTPRMPLITSPSHASTLAHLVLGAAQEGRVNDMFALQAILALQLYLYATRALRPAMHLSGILSKLACEAGLHRCPDRYKSTFVSPADRMLRKRAFHSFYTLDRILSAEFGMPIMLSDTDIDTCLPGDAEKHDEGESSAIHPARTPVDERAQADENAGTAASTRKRKRTTEALSSAQSGHLVASPSRTDQSDTSSRAATSVARSNDDETEMKRLAAANAIILMAKMIGRAMELFNKSLRHRSLSPQEALRLRTDLDHWWNDLGLDNDEHTVTDPRLRYTTLFTCLYHQQIINLNRPALSLSPDQTQHAYALQSTIASVRTVISVLNKDVAAGVSCFWPGYVDMVFFGCLILVYGAKQNKQARDSQTRLHIDLQRALKLLQHFETRWKHLRSFLKIVQSFISRVDPSSTSLTTQTESQTLDAIAPPPFDFDQHFSELLAGDFHFDFSTFELDPENTWAYHMSVPASPLL